MKTFKDKINKKNIHIKKDVFLDFNPESLRCRIIERLNSDKNILLDDSLDPIQRYCFELDLIVCEFWLGVLK